MEKMVKVMDGVMVSENILHELDDDKINLLDNIRGWGAEVDRVENDYAKGNLHGMMLTFYWLTGWVVEFKDGELKVTEDK